MLVADPPGRGVRGLARARVDARDATAVARLRQITSAEIGKDPPPVGWHFGLEWTFFGEPYRFLRDSTAVCGVTLHQ